MKYKRMLCWVRPHEKKELKEAVNGQFSLILTNNYDNFKDNITDDSYIAISLTVANKNLKYLKKLLQDFPNKEFNIILNCNCLYNKVIDIFSDEEKVYNHFTISQLVENFNQKVESQRPPTHFLKDSN